MHVHTLTTDNGKETAQHENIAARFDADAEFSFAQPYASWERGANENMYGLIRQFSPKKMRFEFAMHRLTTAPEMRRLQDTSRRLHEAATLPP